MGNSILIIEDEKTIVDILNFNLKREGFNTSEAYDGETGLNLALTGNPDLILLDVMLPAMDGFEVCRRIRDNKMTTPVIMLTAREEEADKVLGLELGADDYITKPFSMRELLARVKANIRRTAFGAAPSSDKEEKLTAGNLTVNLERYQVQKNGKDIDLTLREYELIKFLMTHPNKVFSREELMEKVWNYEYFGDVRTVDVTIRRLREKIEDNPAEPEYIITRRGVGYLLSK